MIATPRIPGPQTPLITGETVLALWRPRFWIFAQRALLLGFVTALALSGFGILVWWQWLLALPILTVAYVLVFDDFSTWFRRRSDCWYLTNRRLIYENRENPEDQAAVPLSEIAWMRPWFWWSLRIGLTGGTATAMRFVPNPHDIRRCIQTAKDQPPES